MSAAVVSSSPAAWTPLATDLRPVAEDAIGNRMEEVSLNGIDFTTMPPELVQVIELAQLGWGAQLGTGKRLGYWATVALLRDFLTAHVNKAVPTRG